MDDSNVSVSRKRKLLYLIATEDDDLEGAKIKEAIVELLKEDDDELLVLLAAKLLPSARTKRNCIRNYLEDVVPMYNDDEFRTHFRINRALFVALTERFKNNQLYEELREDKRFPASKYLLIFLWFSSHEACSIRDIADRFDASLSSISRIINRVTMFLSSLAEEALIWPSSTKMEETAQHFKEKSGFPKIIGAIDGTHIVIDPPKQFKDDYIDRKGNSSICLQAICDENKKFIDIFVGYPGSVHDSRVLQNSFIFPKLESICKDYYILGDSAYPLMKNLLTPYRNNGHLTAAQREYNRKLSSCRVVIEHAFGLLKQRFRQLYYCKLRGMEKLNHFVRACCVLHNLANEDDLHFNLNDYESDESEIIPEPEASSSNAVAKALRDSVCQQIFELTRTQ